MRLIASLGAVIFAVLATGITQRADAFELLLTERGTPLSRTASTTDFFVQNSLSAANAKAIRKAVDQWHHQIGSIMPIRYAGQVTNLEAIDSSEIFILPNWSSEYGALEETVAHTRLLYNSESGVISQSDLLLNGEAFEFGETKADYHTQSVVLHELGHALGFAHSCGEAGRTYPSCFQVNDREILEAVMAPTLPIGTKRLQFSLDDIEGMRSVYGNVLSIHEPKFPVSFSPDCERQVWVAEFVSPASLTKVTARTLDGMFTELSFQIVEDNRVEIDIPDFLQSESVDIWFEWPDESIVSVLYDKTAEKEENCEDMHNTLLPSQDEAPQPPEGSCGCRTSSNTKSPVFPFVFLVFFIVFRVVSKTSFKLIMLGGLVLSLFPAQAHAYRCTRVGTTVGPSLIWLERNIDWYLGEQLTADFGDQTKVVDIVKKSFASWENQSCSDLSFSFQGQKPNLEVRFNQDGLNENVVVFIKQGWLHQPGVVALTLNAFNRANGVILDTDIEINDEFFVWGDTEQMCSTQMDLENALTHEIGHFIGLSHPPNTPEFENTTMFASAEPCEVKKRSLEPDDIEGLCDIYPQGQPNQQCFPPEGPGFVQVEKDLGYGCQSIDGKSFDFWILSLLFFAFIRRRK
ncbi:MAG: matrixin family metalloprotease [Myxococcota bacterium]|nr:matrixin family metalloprotease [Myxococcota bacterium]